jgi:hypothetical protein
VLLPRLDVRPRDGDARGGHHRRPRFADLRQGRRADLPGRGRWPQPSGSATARQSCRGGRLAGSLDPNAIKRPITERPGNWRFGAENGFDDGHAKYLHRNALWTKRVKMPVWSKIRVLRDGPWITAATSSTTARSSRPRRVTEEVVPQPPHQAKVSLRLPCSLRVKYETWTHWSGGPIDEDDTYIQLATMNYGSSIRFWFYYRLVRYAPRHNNDEDRRWST